MRSVKFYHRKTWSDIVGPGFVDFTNDGTRHKENVKTTDFARENFGTLGFWRKCFYRFMLWHSATRVIVFYNCLADLITISVRNVKLSGMTESWPLDQGSKSERKKSESKKSEKQKNLCFSYRKPEKENFPISNPGLDHFKEQE